MQEKQQEKQEEKQEEKQDLYQQRLEKLARIRESGDEPFKYAFDRTHSIGDACREFEESEVEQGPRVKLSGRLLAMRMHGKTTFADLGDDTEKMQLFFGKKDIGDEKHEFLTKLLNIDDFIGVEGEMFTTRTGQTTLRV